jgi:predicted nuclease of restriction endonuclease-like (RecB) superfamily
MKPRREKKIDEFYRRVIEIIEGARTHVTRSVNVAMIHSYWLIGREIIEEEQKGASRAGYGEELLKRLATQLAARFGKGFSYPNVKRMRQFYLVFPKGSALPEHAGTKKGSTLSSLSSAARKSVSLVKIAHEGHLFPPELSWSHYCLLIRVEHETARRFYEIEAIRENWSVRELERQIAAFLFERLMASKNKERVLALGKRGQEVGSPEDVLKDPMVLEFLDLKEKRDYLERDVEQAIMDRLQDFLLELGKGFCFVARQKRITLEADHFYIDLVFYNRLLRCFVLIDLKLGKITHHDLGQMQMYTNYYDRYQRDPSENPTIGIILCSEKNDAMVQITLPEDNRQIFAPRYRLYLPSEEELRRELLAGRRHIENRKSIDS